jgi:hypothetical protein
MTTFTMQDLNQLPNTPEEDEAMRELFEKMGQDLTGKVPVLNISDGGRTVHYQTAPNAPVPQPSEMGEPLPKSEVSPEALIEHMVAQFSTNLRLLLTTIISQPKAQPEEAQGNSLQECVETTLEQARWFKEMVEQHVAECVESEVEDYFQHGFDPTNYFDFADAVSSEVHDTIDDAVRDHIDDAVADKVEEAVAERMKSIRVVFD